MKKRLLLFFLSAVMVLSNISLPTYAAPSKDDLKRTVYLYSNENMARDDYTERTENKANGIAYAGKELSVRLAVDAPNKGETKLNGYFIKLYYDPTYLKLKNNSVKDALDYNYGFEDPANATDKFQFYKFSNSTFPEQIGENNLDNLQTTSTIGGITYNVISIGLFYSGLELPSRDVANWYDILGIEFVADAEAAGRTTDVFIETGVFNETDKGFCLFSKHRKDGETDGEKYFNSTILNGGRYTINIKDIDTPAAPYINKATGSYTPNALGAGSIEITAEAGCDIWYSTDPTAPDYINLDASGNDESGKYIKVSGNNFVYPSAIDKTTTIKAFASRTANGTTRFSYPTSRTYRIVPHSPSLFYEESGTKYKIYPPHYEADKPFKVWIDDGNTFDGSVNAATTRLFYTFSLADENKVLDIEYTDTTVRNPKEEWVMIQPSEMNVPISITENCNIRIVTRIMSEISGVTQYDLSIIPPPALIKEDSQKPTTPQQPVDAELVCENEYAEIFYTIDGSDPRTNGLPYTGAIPIRNNENGGVILTTVAKYNDVYSELTTYKYDFGMPSSLWVKASHPSGDYYGEIEVHLISTNADDEIYYTFDLSKDPKTDGEEYDRQNPILINEDKSIKAVAKDKDGNYSDVQTFFYYVKPKAPTFAPETTQFSESGSVTILSDYDGQTGYQLWITTNGDDPRTVTGETVKKVDGSYYKIDNIDKYTVIKAVTAKKSGDKWILSELVTHTYDVVVSRPAKPTPTLTQGTYTLTADMDGYKTSFVPMGDDITIYCSVSSSLDSPYPPEDPVGDSYLWDGSPIPIKGETIIKAVAEDSFGVRSQIGVYYYNIVPEKPIAPASTTYTDMDFIPVTVVEGSDFTYTINGTTHTVPKEKMQDRTKVYIDTTTGCAYSDESKTEKLDNEAEQTITSPITLDMYCEKDGVRSGTSTYKYALGETPAAPFVVKNPGGEYPQKKQGGTDAYIVVELDSLEKDGTIEYCIGSENIDDPTAWKPYPSTGIEISDDCELYARVKADDGTVSNLMTEIYTFKPLPPVISPISGTYSSDTEVIIKFDENASVPKDSTYIIKYSVNGEVKADEIYQGQEKKITVTDNATVKAWVVEVDKNGNPVDQSEPAVNYYFIDKTTAGSGIAQFGSPFDTRHRFATWELNGIAGIQLKSSNPQYQIKYKYKYSPYDQYSDEQRYINTPIAISPSMTDITVNAWLIDGNTPVPNSGIEDTFYFVDLGIPKTDKAEGSYTSTQTVKLINEIKTAYPNSSIYYTTDSTADESKFVKYTDAIDSTGITVSSSTTIRARYYDPCGACGYCLSGDYDNCTDSIWGKIGSFDYYITKSTGGGGGGGGGSYRPPATTNKKYTIDYFGNEHPYHESYLNGYPDGSVQADGNITREETAAILYRVYNKSYTTPTPATGDKYPDVSADMWSADSIEYLSDVGLIKGYPDGMYMPKNNITRAEFAAMIVRWLELDTDITLTDEDKIFSDVEEEYWAYKDIYALSKSGYITGYEDETFRPLRPISRAEAVTIINRILGRKPDRAYLMQSDFNPYTDLEGDKWYYEQVLEATISHYYDLSDTEYKWYLQIN